MSEFVNYQKRGIELPPGSKDLIDVLRLPGSTEGSTPAMSWQWSERRRLAREGRWRRLEGLYRVKD